MVAIKGMKMPNSCYDCDRKRHCEVGIDGGWRTDIRVEGCPLVEIKEHSTEKLEKIEQILARKMGLSAEEKAYNYQMMIIDIKEVLESEG